MSNLDWILITFLIIISGIIAFLGNYIGRRAGKRRISILGIRPYYTSMIITVITGILITAVTLLILLSISSSMRTALESKAQLQETIKMLSQKLSITQSELSIRASELSAAIEYQKKLENSILKQTKKIESLKGEIKNLEKELKEKESALEASKRNLNNLREQRERLSETVAKLSKDRERLKIEEENLKREINILNIKLKKVEDEASSMEQEISFLKKEREDLITQIGDYKKELSQLKKQIVAYNAQVEALKRDISEKEKELSYLRNQKIIFQGGEVLLAETINGPKTEKEAKDTIDYLIEKAKEIVRYRYLSIEEDIPKDFSFIYNPEDIKFAIESLKEKQRVIRIRVKNNTFIGEPINLNIESLKSRLVFHNGEVIASRFISSKISRNKIIEELNNLLKDVKREGLKRGMLQDPITGSLVNVPYETLLNLSVKIKVQYSKVGSALVVVKASNDIYTAGPLNVKFELR